MVDQRPPVKAERRSASAAWESRQAQAMRVHRYKNLILRQRMFSPIWTLLILLLLSLTIVNVLISLKLTYLADPRDAGAPNETGAHYVQEESPDMWFFAAATSTTTSGTENDDSTADCPSNTDRRQTGFRYVNGGGRFDNSRRYLIHEFVQMADRWPVPATQLTNTPGSVCLATQASVERLHHLAEVAGEWAGPVSAAVFAPAEEFHVAVRYVRHLRRCYAAVRENVSFHVLYPRKYPPRHLPALQGNLSLTCAQADKSLRIMLALRPHSLLVWRGALLYPQNHLRNVARKGCPSSHVFLTDVDIIPRQGLAASLTHFLRHPGCERCAFVVPTYEVDDQVRPLPGNKSALVALVRQRRAQPFHQVVFINNQYATNSSKWERLAEGEGSSGTDEMGVAYAVTNFELYYEPFYVATDDVPPHDERFVGYGYTRNTQVYEMYVAGYKFLVLNSAFAMHRGLKRKKTKNSWREKQNRANSRQFKKFEREILARHNYNKKT